jgi:L-ascorbate metabolism protein UlaG (beta-lactamase superfamily)
MKKRNLFWIAGAALAVAGASWALSLSSDGYEGTSSAHFDGKRFRNAEGIEHGFFAFFKWITNRDRGVWRDWIESEPGPAPPERVGPGELRVTWVNHATLLVQLDEVNILTDPVWSHRVSPVSWAGPRRHRDPGIRFEDLPPIDVVVVSHNHYDHMDLATLRRLDEAHSPVILSGLGNAAFLKRKGLSGTRDLDWWESDEVRGVTVTAVPARHFSSRGPTDRDRTLWAGFVFSGPAGSVYFAGDTGYGSHFAEIGTRLGPIDVALLPIGAFRPRWFMSPVHIDPREAIEAHRDLGAALTIPMHYGTFPLGDDGETEPVDVLRQALDDAGETGFAILEMGESWEKSADAAAREEGAASSQAPRPHERTSGDAVPPPTVVRFAITS